MHYQLKFKVMTQIEAFTKELESEAIATRKMLSRVPADKFDWTPHEKSMKLKALATHIAELPTWIGMALNTDELDFESNPYDPVKIESTEELVAYFEKCLEEGKRELASASEDILDKPWTLRNGATIYSTDPKWAVIRMALSQVIHHRAQLGVYLRLLDIAIPGTYGPSADESF